jgi:hypothetical protein
MDGFGRSEFGRQPAALKGVTTACASSEDYGRAAAPDEYCAPYGAIGAIAEIHVPAYDRLGLTGCGPGCAACVFCVRASTFRARGGYAFRLQAADFRRFRDRMAAGFPVSFPEAGTCVPRGHPISLHD